MWPVIYVQSSAVLKKALPSAHCIFDSSDAQQLSNFNTGPGGHLLPPTEVDTHHAASAMSRRRLSATVADSLDLGVVLQLFADEVLERLPVGLGEVAADRPQVAEDKRLRQQLVEAQRLGDRVEAARSEQQARHQLAHHRRLVRLRLRREGGGWPTGGSALQVAPRRSSAIC